MQPKGQNRGNPCSDSQFQAQTCQSMQHNLSFRRLPCIDSRFQAQTCESMQPKGQNRGNPCSTSSARVPSRVDDAACLRCLASHELDSSLTAVRQWRQKRVLMRPEAAFPYVFAAEGAQHPPIGRHAQRTVSQTTTAATLNGQPRKRQQPQRPSAGAASRLFLGIEQIGTAESLEGLDIRLPAGLDIL